MSRGIITISETGAVTMPTAPVWMMQFEIADLFGVFSCNVRKMGNRVSMTRWPEHSGRLGGYLCL